MTDSKQLAVITGASSGIGLELARNFARKGFDIVIAAEDQELAAATAELSGDSGDVHAVRTDLATPEGVEMLAAAITSTGRPVDALCINAGIGNGGAFVDIPLEDEQRLLGLNIAHPVHLAKRLLPGMVRRGRGRVLFTSSIAATMPGPFYATYAASKAFVLSFAEALRHELKDTGVTVTALMPGPADTEFFERGGLQDTPVGSMKKDDPAEVARDGYEAMMAGKDHVVAGSLKNKLQAAGAKMMSERQQAAVHAQQTRPSGGR